MAGSLIKIQETTVTSSVASVTLTGIDSTYDVYMVKVFGATCTTSTSVLTTRFTVGGVAQSGTDYDYAMKFLRDDTTFSNVSATNDVDCRILLGTNNTGGSGVLYLFNFNNSSEYSFITTETVYEYSAGGIRGAMGGGVQTVAETNDGIQFLEETAGNNITGGTFSLYGLKK